MESVGLGPSKVEFCWVLEVEICVSIVSKVDFWAAAAVQQRPDILKRRKCYVHYTINQSPTGD